MQQSFREGLQTSKFEDMTDQDQKKLSRFKPKFPQPSDFTEKLESHLDVSSLDERSTRIRV